MPGFWAGGKSQYVKALVLDYKDAKSQLKQQLKRERDPLVREELAASLAKLKTEHGQRLSNAAKCLY